MKALVNQGVQSLDPEPVTFLGEFGVLIKWMLGLFVLAVLIFSVAEDGSWPIAVGGFSMMGFLMIAIILMSEGPSYAMYVKRRSRYFHSLYQLVKESSDYEVFVSRYSSI